MKTMSKLFDKTWKKCVWIFLIVSLIVGIGGAFSLNYLNDAVTNSHVHSDIITVQNKLYGDNPYSDHYIIVGTNNKTYSIVDHGDNYGKDMFDVFKVGQRYKVIVKEPDLTDVNQFTHILQVYDSNDTSSS